ncbi:MAG: NADAR family protein [Hespellia sp.]|nr:NADAR family protein [Hespellia sp.]
MNTYRIYPDTRPVIASFRDSYAFLSNFYYAEITYGNLRFANNEAAFQAQKSTCARERRQFCTHYLKNPADAKRLGKSINLRPDWNTVKLRYMYEICMTKFLQHPELGEKLLATGNAILIEENTWGDRYWGAVNGYGDNHLGEILMDIRSKLQLEREYQRTYGLCSRY